MVVGLLSWPVVSLVPPVGLDPSWQAGLHMAVHFDLKFGDEITWTYGPLGFFAIPLLFYLPTTALSVGALTAAHFTAIAVVAKGLSRAFGLLATAVITLVVATVAIAQLAGAPELLAALLVVACARAGLGDCAALGGTATVALGALAAFIMLIKISAGLVALAVLGVAVAAPVLGGEERGRRLGLAALALFAYLASLSPFVDARRAAARQPAAVP